MDARATTPAATRPLVTGWAGRVRPALYPLDAPPAPPGWNHDYLLELIGDAPRRDAAVLLAVRDVAEPRMVFTLRRAGLAQHGGQVSFPGGGVEAGDADAIATAMRESREEIALDPAAAEPLGYLDCLETISGYCVTPVVARLAPDAVLTAQPDEVAQVFEVPLRFLLEPRNLRQFEYRVHAERRKVYEYVGVAPRIWGATALMLVNLMQRMGTLQWPQKTS